jgi:hypothetical protein
VVKSHSSVSKLLEELNGTYLISRRKIAEQTVFAKLPIFGKPITDLKLPIGNGNYRR